MGGLRCAAMRTRLERMERLYGTAIAQVQGVLGSWREDLYKTPRVGLSASCRRRCTVLAGELGGDTPRRVARAIDLEVPMPLHRTSQTKKASSAFPDFFLPYESCDSGATYTRCSDKLNSCSDFMRRIGIELKNPMRPAPMGPCENSRGPDTPASCSTCATCLKARA